MKPYASAENTSPPGALQEDRDGLKAAIFYNCLVKFVVGVFLFACWAAIVAVWDRDSKSYQPLPFVFVPVLVFLSGFWGLLYVKSEEQEGPNFPFPSRFTLRKRAREFPLMLLVFDFLNLALLLAFTGGIKSIFLPLFLVALLLGDVSISERKRPLMLAFFLVGVVAGVLAPKNDAIRNLLINAGNNTTTDSVWVLREEATVALGLVVFIAGSVFGSNVLRWYKKRGSRKLAVTTPITDDGTDGR